MHQIARLTIGRLRAPVDDEINADFAPLLERIEAASTWAHGFVWRGDLTDLVPNPTTMADLTVWRSPHDLERFVSGPIHEPLEQRRSDWFEDVPGPHEVLWWVSSLRHPTLEEGIARLQALSANGPSLRAFTIDEVFPPN